MSAATLAPAMPPGPLGDAVIVPDREWIVPLEAETPAY